jgi:hypothetical protein
MQVGKLLVVGSIGLSIVAGACSSSSSSSSSPSSLSSASPSVNAYCSQEQAVKDSYNALVDTDVTAEGTNTLKTRFDTFSSDLASFKTAAGSQFSSEMTAVQTSVDQLKTIVDDADTAGVATTATQFAVGLTTLKTSIETLFAAVDAACNA